MKPRMDRMELLMAIMMCGGGVIVGRKEVMATAIVFQLGGAINVAGAVWREEEE